MKSLLPVLLCGLCATVGATAQTVSAPLATHSLRPTLTPSTAKAHNTPQRSMRPQNAPRPVPEKQRSHHELSYFADGTEFARDWTLGTLGQSYDELHATYKGYGLAQLYPQDLLSRYENNTITSINFYCCGGKFTNGRAFIIDTGTNEMVWMGQIGTITPTTDYKNWQLNSVPCDYTITGLETALLIGWVADAEEDPNDPYREQGVYFPIYNDPTDSGLGCYVMGVNAETDELEYIRTDARYYDYYGKLSNMCAYMTIDTEGSSAIGDNDAQLTEASSTRGLVGNESGAYSTLSFTNFGLDPISSLTLTCDIDGQQSEQTVKLDQPVTYYKSGKVRVPALVGSSEGVKQGTMTVTKVNGAEDEYSLNDDNVTSYKAVSMLSGYKRVPAVESFTSTTNGEAPLGYAALAKAQDQLGEFVPINIHVDYDTSLGSDPYVTDTYNSIVLVYATRFPSALVNRETLQGFDYQQVPEVAAQVADGMCEAQLGLEAAKPADGATSLSVTANLDFKFDVADEQYGIAYVFTEDGLQTDQLSTLPLNLAAEMKNNPELTQEEALEKLGYTDPITREAATEAYEDADGNFWYTTTLNDVACSISQSVGKTALVPATKAGETAHVTTTLSLPQRTPAVNLDNLKLAALLIDQTSGVVVTAKQIKVNEGSTGIAETTDRKVDVQIADGAFVVKAAHAEASVYSVDGRLVSSATVQGEASLPTFGHGVYVIKVTCDGQTTSQKALF